MPLDMKFDPVTQDEIDDGHGSPTMTARADTTVLHALLCHYGECWQDAELGSRLHDLNALQSDPAALGASEARRALERVEATGRIADLEVEAELVSPGRLHVGTRYRDSSTSQVVTSLIPTGG